MKRVSSSHSRNISWILSLVDPFRNYQNMANFWNFRNKISLNNKIFLNIFQFKHNYFIRLLKRSEILQKIQIYYRDYIVCVATWLAVHPMGAEDVYTPKSGKRLRGHAPPHPRTREISLGYYPSLIPSGITKKMANFRILWRHKPFNNKTFLNILKFKHI